jgi:hypothetical protein
MRRLLWLAIVCFLALALVAGAGSARKGPARLAAYRGLATWVDLYDAQSWAAPETVVDAMAQHGVRTLFLETGNYSHASRVYEPDFAARFIDAAHANGMRIVAWYLPDFAHPRHDFLRSLGAIRFRTPDGQRFDSFGLDIESSVVQDVQLRNARLLALSRRLRAAVGRSYALGAIIPSPRGMQLLPQYWTPFPYRRLARVFDVFLPMGYFTYRPHDLGGAFGYTARNITLIRQKTGRPHVAVHPIGGLADKSSLKQTHDFVRATKACGVFGASLYDFSTTRAGQWPWLARIPQRRQTPRPSCTS